MTHTTGIGHAYTPSAALDAVGSTTSARTAVSRTSAKDASAVKDTSGTANLSSLGSILAIATPGTDDVRVGKVAALKSAIDGGTYNVPASAVADKLISGLLG